MIPQESPDPNSICANANATASHAIPFISQHYTNTDSDASARMLILALRPDWSSADSNIELIRFTDGITNTLLKAQNRRPGISEADMDRDAILLRAYGHGTDLIIDRTRETQNHELLSQHGLAPALLGKFENGMLYRFVRGRVTHPEDLRRPEISLAIARRLAQWHATVPCLPGKTHVSARVNGHRAGGVDGYGSLQEAIDAAAPHKLAPNVWTVMQKWIFALPTETKAQKDRQALLQGELKKLVAEMSHRPGLGKNGLVFAHCDLLSGNVIVLPANEPTSSTGITDPPEPAASTTPTESVTFIDYEYAVPSPAAFDLANHFAEWGGFDCDFSVLPARSHRRAFVQEYIRTYYLLAYNPGAHVSQAEAEAVEHLLAEVDVYRGVPGFYWGIWALIQATISEIEFDYASYAEVRLGEYWAWRAEEDGSRKAKGAMMPLRESRWAEE